MPVSVAQLTTVLFRETSPTPLKYALSLLGLMSPKVRLPLVELTDASRAEVAAAMRQVCEDYADYAIGNLCEPELRRHLSSRWLTRIFAFSALYDAFMQRRLISQSNSYGDGTHIGGTEAKRASATIIRSDFDDCPCA